MLCGVMVPFVIALLLASSVLSYAVRRGVCTLLDIVA